MQTKKTKFDLWPVKSQGVPLKDIQGFTLVEMLVTLVISSILMIAMYSAYQTQQKTYVVQDQVAAMQQNIRAAMYFMVSELRMVGFDIENSDALDIDTTDATVIPFASAGVLGAAKDYFYYQEDPLVTNRIRFRADLNEDGDTTGDYDEDVAYGLYDSDGITRLGREDYKDTVAPDFYPIAENFDALEFEYLDEDGTAINKIDDLEDTRAIRIFILAKSTGTLDDLDGTQTYTMPSGDVNRNDGIRRRLLSTTVNLRNMSFN